MDSIDEVLFWRAFGATILEFNEIASPFLLFLFCYFFTVSISAIICFKRFDRFLPFEPLKITSRPLKSIFQRNISYGECFADLFYE